MANSVQSSNTTLEAIALRERELLDSVAQAEREAEQIVAQARRDADALKQQRQAELDQENARLRTEAAAQREQTRQTILAGASDRVSKVREDAAGHVPQAVDELVARVLPRRGTGDVA